MKGGYAPSTKGEEMEALIESLRPEPVRAIEVGVAHAGTTVAILENTDRTKVHCIDPRQVSRVLVDRLDNPRVVFHAGFSQEKRTRRKLPRSFDWVFIDGCHCVTCCSMDIKFFSKYLSSGGTLVVHDTNDEHVGGVEQECLRLSLPRPVRIGLALSLCKKHLSRLRLIREVKSRCGMKIWRKK